MEKISSYLLKFTNILNSEAGIREMVVDALEKVCGIKVEKKDVSVVDGSVSVKVSPIMRSEIHLRKERIMEFLKGRNTNISNLR